MKILLVEDEEYNLTVMEEILKLLLPSAQITTVINGQIAYETLQKKSFDLIISDINMPVMDGYGLIKKIKEEMQLKTPVIAATAFAIDGDKEKIIHSGFDDYISKPIDISELKNLLMKYKNINENL